MVEQLTLNQLVPGSSPGGRTSLSAKWLESGKANQKHAANKSL